MISVLTGLHVHQSTRGQYCVVTIHVYHNISIHCNMPASLTELLVEADLLWSMHPRYFNYTVSLSMKQQDTGHFRIRKQTNHYFNKAKHIAFSPLLWWTPDKPAVHIKHRGASRNCTAGMLRFIDSSIIVLLLALEEGSLLWNLHGCRKCWIDW